MTPYEQMQAAGKTAADIEKVTIRHPQLPSPPHLSIKGPLNNPRRTGRSLYPVYGRRAAVVRTVNRGGL